MRLLVLIFICFSLSPLKSESQTDSLWTIEGLSNVTVYLYQKINDNSGVGGSATIISHKNKFYLLTANHVAKEMKLTSQIVFHLEGDKPGIVNLNAITKNNQLNWITHSEADISLIELMGVNYDVKQRLLQWSFPSSLIYDGDETLARDNDVTFFGYPIMDLDIKRFSALSFSSYLASGLITNYRYDIKKKCTFFYLDKPSMQGCSGAGVYASVKKAQFYNLGKTLFLGIVHGTAKDNSGGKLAAITPSFYVWDLLKTLK